MLTRVHRMTLFVLAVVLVGLAVAPVGRLSASNIAPLAGSDLIGTGTIEIDVNGDKVPDGWKRVSPSGLSKIKCDKPAVGKFFSHSGSCAFMLRSTGGKEKLEWEYKPVGGGSTGDAFTLDLYASGVNIPLSGEPEVKIVAVDQNGNKQILSKVELPTGSYGYTLFTFNFAAPFNYQKIKIEFEYEALSGKLLIDDVTLVQTAP